MTNGDDVEKKRQAALQQLRQSKRGASSAIDATSGLKNAPPAQMRDATKPVVSQHFSLSTADAADGERSSKILVPSSSPASSSKAPNGFVPKMGHHPPTNGKGPKGVFRGHLMEQESLRGFKPQTRPSLSQNTSSASSSRPNSVRKLRDDADETTDHPPRKKLNLGQNSAASTSVTVIDLSPSSSGVSQVRDGVKVMEIDSSPSASNNSSSPQKPRGRLIRGRPPPSPATPMPSTKPSPATTSLHPTPSILSSDQKYIEQIIKQYPLVSPTIIREIWKQEKGIYSKVAEAIVTRFPRKIPIDLTKAPTVPPRSSLKGKEKQGHAPVAKAAPPRRGRQPSSDTSDADLDSEASDDSDEDREVRVVAALSFFNNTTPENLVEVTGCSVTQAQTMIAARPFTNESDIKKKFNRKKGISARYFEEYISILAGYDTVDGVIEKCELIGKQISDILALWASAIGPAEEPKAENVKTSAAIDLVAVPVDVPAESSKEQDAARAEAMKDYIREQPSTLASGVALKDYQLLGLNWLALLHRKNLSCILADEMGLGKTVQVISFLAHLKEQGNRGPHLIIVPYVDVSKCLQRVLVADASNTTFSASTLENWGREFEKFAPSLEVRTYYGSQNERISQRQELMEELGQWEVCITTYNLAQGNDFDKKFFKRIDWEACVFDEGHVLKNYQSQRYNHLMKIGSRWRLLLTGTPLQNNLQELVSLMNFILPSYFKDVWESLRAIFKVRADAHTSLLSESRVTRASKMMTPFVLRRRKDQVLKDLPNKIERIEWCDMTPMQRKIYDEAMQRSRKAIEDLPTDEKALLEAVSEPKKKAKKGVLTTSSTSSSNVLMDLRKASCHPMLFRRLFDQPKIKLMARHCLQEPDFMESSYNLVVEDMEVMNDAELQRFCLQYKSVRKHALDKECFLDAGKVTRLLPLLEEYKKENKRVLIFSQFTQVLDILRSIFDHLSIKYLLLTGQTPVSERQSMVDEFTEDESIPVFLLSTKAGGMGINLTAACVVIIFDQDFNPHNDKQACDRAYRIGQKRDVEVVKLITRGSIEESMLRLGQIKLDLDQAVAAGEGNEEEESAAEKGMKASLLSVLRKQFEEEGANQKAAAEAASAASTEPPKPSCDLDEKPPTTEDVVMKDGSVAA